MQFTKSCNNNNKWPSAEHSHPRQKGKLTIEIRMKLTTDLHETNAKQFDVYFPNTYSIDKNEAYSGAPFQIEL